LREAALREATLREAARRIGAISHHLSALRSCRHRLPIPSLGEVIVWRSSEWIVVGPIWRGKWISLLIW
jgi:hypothetical protein